MEPQPVCRIAPAADRFQDDYEQARLRAFRAKLGLTDAARPGDAELIESLLGELATNGADYTLAWRHLADALTSGEPIAEVSEGWMAAWQARVPGEPAAVAEAMNRTNPLYVPRNHLVEAALEEAAEGERAAYDRLVAAVRSPYAAVPGQEDLATPAPPGFTARHVTYCGTALRVNRVSGSVAVIVIVGRGSVPTRLGTATGLAAPIPR